MFGSNLRLVPWRDKDEWLKVYQNAYSSEIDKQISACQTMELWLIMRNDVPPGVECTVNLLMALISRHQVPAPTPRQLQLTLSSAILRVINMLCDNARVSEKQTMFSIAKLYNLPEWIISLRHDISHSQVLPTIAALVPAATFLLTWLKELYWEVEREEMKDIRLNKCLKEICVENLDYLLDVYVNLMNICSTEPRCDISQLPPSLRLRVEDANRRRGLCVAIQTMPWIRHSRESFGKELSCSTDGIKVSGIVDNLLSLLLDYLPVKQTRAWQVNALPIIISTILQYSKSHPDMEKQVWGHLIQKLNSVELLDKMALELCRCGEMEEERQRWLEGLIVAAAKRHRLDRLWAEMSTCSSRLTTEGETIAAKATMRRRRLGLPLHSIEGLVLTRLFKRIEKRHPELRCGICLRTSVQYLVDNCTALDIIKLSLSSPQTHTLRLLPHLVVLMKPEMDGGRLAELTDLILISLGEKAFGKLRTGFNVKTLSDLVSSSGKNFSPHITNQLESSNSCCSHENLTLPKTEVHGSQPTQSEFAFVRSGWNFNGCPLGISPWELNGCEYYHIPFDSASSQPNQYIFPISPHRWIPPLYKSV